MNYYDKPAADKFGTYMTEANRTEHHQEAWGNRTVWRVAPPTGVTAQAFAAKLREHHHTSYPQAHAMPDGTVRIEDYYSIGD